MVRVRRVAEAVALGALSMTLGLVGPWPAAEAAGVDGAGRIVIVPLVVTGDRRESLVTVTNSGTEDLIVTGLYVGAEGTSKAASVFGPIACDPRMVPRGGSLALPLRDLCRDAYSPDVENLGYLELTSTADAHANFFATSVVDNLRASSFGVAGQPAGSHDSGRSGVTTDLQVSGLRTRATAQDEVLTCWIASLDEPKKVDAELRDDKGGAIGSASFHLDARRMIAFDVQSRMGLAFQDRDPLSVAFRSGDPSLVIAACGPVHPQTDVLSYQPAQAANPADRARLRSVEVFAGTTPGPYQVGAVWKSWLAGDTDYTKVVLSTYLRSDDVIRCRVIDWVGPNGATAATAPFTEIQILDPTGGLVGGGSGARDTGVVSTLPRGRFAPGTSQRYLIQVGYDEDVSGWPFGPGHGVWGIHCESGSGMSEPVLLFTRFADDF